MTPPLLQPFAAAKRRWYWGCQGLGWAGFWLTQLQAHLMLGRYEAKVPLLLAVSAIIGLALTHGYRALLLRFRVLSAPLAVQAGAAVLGLLGLAVGSNLLRILAYGLLQDEAAVRWPGWSTFSFGVVGEMRYLVVWVLAYHFFVVGEHLARAQVQGLQADAARRQAELDLLRSQINPHFLFNALNSVRALTLSDPHRARTAVTQLAELLRYTLNYEQRQLISLGEELAAVRDYLALEQTRFGPERLRLDVAVPDEVLDWPVPPTALLTLVENAVKHGIGASPAGGILRLAARASPAARPAAETLRLEVSQPGRLPSSPKPAQAAARPGGLGLANTRLRLLALYGEAARLTLHENPGGTVVASLDLPAGPLPR